MASYDGSSEAVDCHIHSIAGSQDPVPSDSFSSYGTVVRRDGTNLGQTSSLQISVHRKSQIHH
eukprot:scaffold8908_cov106-Skeletonema_dohrnii-CCMP3373.AAC.7